MNAAALNRLLAAGADRAEHLTFRLAKQLEPILRAAGREAARNFAGRATNHLTAAAPGVTPLSTMICLKPRPEEAAAVAQAQGLPPDELHVTLCYLGEVEDDGLRPVQDALEAVAGAHGPLEGAVGGVGIFAPDDEGVGPSILLPDVPGLVELRVAVSEALYGAGIEYARNHGFAAHITVDYYQPGDPGFEPPLPMLEPLHFDSLLLVRADTVVAELPLVGPPPLTASAGWTPPTPDELIDTEALIAKLRGKTDPVRLAAIEAMMGESLAAVGLEWDPQNPFAREILEQSASQVTNIVSTTRDNVNRIIRASYEQGFTIPDTAKAIRRGMADAAGPRAELIARTELVGAVNGGSIAAARTVAAAGGPPLYKQWLTAPGAKHPRHVLYDGLNGQTKPLGGLFDVGGSSLDHPGDPNGPPHDVCNCRCAMIYTESAPTANTIIVPGLGEVPIGPPHVAKPRTPVEEIKDDVAGYDHLSNDEMHSVMTSEARMPLLRASGYAGPALEARELALRGIGEKIEAEVATRVAGSGLPDPKKLKALYRRRQTAFRKASQGLFEAKSNLHDDVLARLFPGRTLGSLNDDEYDAFRAALNAAPELEKFAAREQRANELLREIEGQLDGIDVRVAAARRDHIIAVLSEIRQIGATLAPGSEAVAEVAAVAQKAAALLPADWVRASNDFRRPLHIDWAEEGPLGGRGYYQHHFSRLSLLDPPLIDGESSGLLLVPRRGLINTDVDGLTVAVHELGHRFEYVVPELRFLAWVFHSRRTVLSPNPVNWAERLLTELRPGSGYRVGESTFPDEFTDPYIGKLYGSSAGSSGEVLSMGLEGVLNGEHNIWEGDPDLRNFILGILAAL